MEIDLENLPNLDLFTTPQGMINWWKNKTDEEINEIYEEYYGHIDKGEKVQLVMMVIGQMNFPHEDAIDEYWDKTLVNEIVKILYVPKTQTIKIGEEQIDLYDGEYSWIVPCMCEEEICSNNYWYAMDTNNTPILFDPQMQLVIGFETVEELLLKYPNSKPIKEIDKTKVDWAEYDKSIDCNSERIPHKNPMDCHQRALKAVQLADMIIEENKLYQNLYRTEECYGCLKHDEELWTMTMNKVITTIQDQVEPHKKGDEIQIQSGAGIFHVDEDGNIVDIENYDDLLVLYPNVKRFDLEDYRRWEEFNNLNPTNEIDIIHIGYWKKNGGYNCDDVDKCREQYLKEFKRIHDKRKVA
jgi:hypothetical protein